MSKVRKEDILINPDQIPQAKELNPSDVSVVEILKRTEQKQKKCLSLKDLSKMDFYKVVII
ncbi:MAG TPA: hypothetical protein VIK86_08935 [Candidatus Paceibacterota bacterium]